jgi:DNA-binding IclR family transcriptional regulator
MRRLHDSLYRAVTPPRCRVRPVEQRALTLIAQRPGVTVAELRDALAIGSTRVWQIVAHLEWLGVLHRNGALPRRLGARQPRLPTIRELLDPHAPAHLHTQHQALNTMLIFEHLAHAPRSVSALAEATGTANRTIRRLLARLEHDGYVTVAACRDRRTCGYGLAAAGHELGRTLRAAGHATAAMNTNLQCYTAARTIAVLIHLAAGPRSAPELAELLDVARPTVRRILALLTHGGYVDRLPGDIYRKRYGLTRRSRRLGHQMATAASLLADGQRPRPSPRPRRRSRRVAARSVADNPKDRSPGRNTTSAQLTS